MHSRQIHNPLALANGEVLKNRIVMGAMHTGLESDKVDFKRLTAFYIQRAQGGVGTIITGGFSPNITGRLTLGAAKLTNYKEALKHKTMVNEVQNFGTKMILQILHAGRYGYHPFVVAPSNIKASIAPFSPWKMTNWMIKRTIKHFVRAAKLAYFAGYNGVEIMGSEGYLINQFLASNTNQRQDSWGGNYNNRMKFALAIVSGIRAELPRNFIIIFRISLLDLVHGGSTWNEVLELGHKLVQNGVDILSSGFGWHEASIPTIAGIVPNAAFKDVVKKFKAQLNAPIILSNRINMPEQAEQLIALQFADLISMARPMLSDPQWVNKSSSNQDHLINTCIACNQGCLDEVFLGRSATCMVNPQAGFETELVFEKTNTVKTLAVIGGGPAGLAFARTAALRGHQVTLFEKDDKLGGQFNLAKLIPGKEEYADTIRYFSNELSRLGVTIRLNIDVDVECLKSFDEIIYATGVNPRKPSIDGIDLPHVISYQNLLTGVRPLGKKIVILGAGGVGIDVAEWLISVKKITPISYMHEWGIDHEMHTAGGITDANNLGADNKIIIMQRQAGKIGAKLGKTTGWIHRKYLKNYNVQYLTEVEYSNIVSDGINIKIKGIPEFITADLIVYCTGGIPNKELYDEIISKGLNVHLIGGAYDAKNFDAKFAINQATRLACLV